MQTTIQQDRETGHIWHPISKEDKAAMTVMRAFVEPIEGHLQGTTARGPFDAIISSVVAPVANQVAIVVKKSTAYRQIEELRDQRAQEKPYLQDEIRTETEADPCGSQASEVDRRWTGRSRRFGRHEAIDASIANAETRHPRHPRRRGTENSVGVWHTVTQCQ